MGERIAKILRDNGTRINAAAGSHFLVGRPATVKTRPTWPVDSSSHHDLHPNHDSRYARRTNQAQNYLAYGSPSPKSWGRTISNDNTPRGETRGESLHYNWCGVNQGDRVSCGNCDPDAILTQPLRHRRATAFAYAHQATNAGARHLYLLDYDGENLPNLEESLKKAYPDVKVTTQQADAADEAAISEICKRYPCYATNSDSREKAGIVNAAFFTDLTEAEFMNMMRVNVLSSLLASCFLAIKHGSAAMQITSADKKESSGSIILTASVAGIRSGAGPMDCKHSACLLDCNSIIHTTNRQCQQSGVSQKIVCNWICSSPLISQCQLTRANGLTPTGLHKHSSEHDMPRTNRGEYARTGMTTATFDYARAKGVGGKIGQLVPLKRYGLPQEVR
ncbi:short chain dehydrogenase domain-containing protein [Rhizoctonia solani AG-1 IA]|uniref:Short chain dehydrogenase domain-containing protein n=1 Tax=Thanatephorus cucumeris (strain AG1-IA) TaxID=983506 RepID=L8X1Z5_THACA|nr:short chain dehydrogenase domain-containing protein [Rhizoctonia solani AG-1 IA]